MLTRTRKTKRPCAATGIVLASMLAAALPAFGQEPPPPAQVPAAADPSQLPPAAPAMSPESSRKQLKQQQKQQRRLQKQQLQAAGAGPTASPTMKDIFAGTVAAVVQASGGALLGGIAQVVTGRVVDWFSQKLVSGGASAQPSAAAPAADGQFAEVAADPGASMPMSSTPEQLAATAGAMPVGTGEIAAGLAFEVHRLEPDGATSLVDPAVHEFRTGERFVVFFRPSLPGRMEIHNVNPAGRQMLIDTQELAAGQLTRLGPYEFTATTGDEQLRLVMHPCTTPQLVSATRDIVRVPDTVPPQGGLQLQDCATMVTRSVQAVQTRDIRKVTVEDGTRFALDLVTPEELASGQLAPRQVTLRFRHL